MDRQSAVVFALPIVLLFGSQWTLAALLVVALMVMKHGLIFDDADRRIIAASWTQLARAIGLPRWN